MSTRFRSILLLSAVAAECLLAVAGLGQDGAAVPPPDATTKLEAVRNLMPEVVAKATGWSLDREYVWRRIETRVKRVIDGGGAVPLGLLRYLARPVVNEAIEAHLLAEPAAAAGFAPDRARAEVHATEVLASPQSRLQAEQFLLDNGLSRDEYVEELARRTAIMDWVRQHFVVPQQVTDEELRESYEKRRQEFTLPPTFLLGRILVPRGESDAEEAAAREQLAAIRQTIAEGTPFAVAGKTDTGKVWYDSMRVAARTQPEEIRQVIAQLAMGEVSGIIELSDTLALIRWSEPLPARERSFGEVITGLRLNVQEEKGREVFRTYLADLKKANEVVIYPPLEDSTTPLPRSGGRAPARD